MKLGKAAGAAPTERADREGILAVLQDQPTLEQVRSIIRELHIDDELTLEPTLDAALRRIREGAMPRVLILDLSGSAAPIAMLSAARSVGGPDLLILGLGAVNDIGLFRDLLAAGASDYLAKPIDREAFANIVENRNALAGALGSGLGQVVAFIGSRGGVGTTTAAVACGWLLAEKHKRSTVLVDLDLHFGTIALKLDIEPGTGLCEALEQPSRVDALFVDRATVKITDRLRVLAAEAAVAETLMIDAGAIDVLLYELRRKFAWVLIDLPRWVTPTQRVVLGAASRVVVVCERSLAGLRDTIRLQGLMREHAPQSKVLLVDAGASSQGVTVGSAEFEKAVGKPLDIKLSHDRRLATEASNAGQPLPVVAPHSRIVRDLEQLVAALGGAEEPHKRRLFGLPRR